MTDNLTGIRASHIGDAAPCADGAASARRLRRIEPSPKQILEALSRLRILDRKLRDAGDAAFDAQNAIIPAASLAAFATAEEKLADAERIIRGEISRLETLSRRVSYSPQPKAAGRRALFCLRGGR